MEKTEFLSGTAAEIMRAALKEYLRPLFRTQEDMALKLGCSQPAMSNMLNPRILSPIPRHIASTAAHLLGYPNEDTLLDELASVVRKTNRALEAAKLKYPEFGAGAWQAVYDIMQLRPMKQESPEVCRVFAVLASHYFVLDDEKKQSGTWAKTG